MKHTITNRSNLDLAILVDTPENARNLVFIAHGQGGFKEQLHIEAFTRAFLQNGFRVVRFDATNALGESGGDMMNVTYDSYVNDLEDVIAWAQKQDWFQMPFALCGHSMGAQSTAWYAEHHPDEVSLLVPMAPPVSYELFETTISEQEKTEWRKNGFKEMTSKSKPGVIKRVGWQVNESLQRYSLLPDAGNLTMPVLNIVGEHDTPCPASHQQQFMDLVASSDKALLILPHMDHNYRSVSTDEYLGGLELIERTISNWLHKHVS